MWYPGETVTPTSAGATISVAAGWPSTVTFQPGSKEAFNKTTAVRLANTAVVTSPWNRSILQRQSPDQPTPLRGDPGVNVGAAAAFPSKAMVG